MNINIDSVLEATLSYNLALHKTSYMNVNLSEVTSVQMIYRSVLRYTKFLKEFVRNLYAKLTAKYLAPGDT